MKKGQRKCRARRPTDTRGLDGRPLGWHTCGRVAGHKGFHRCGTRNGRWHCAVEWGPVIRPFLRKAMSMPELRRKVCAIFQVPERLVFPRKKAGKK